MIILDTNTSEFQARFSDLGADPAGGTPDEFRTFMVAHMEKMRKAVVASGARLNSPGHGYGFYSRANEWQPACRW